MNKALHEVSSQLITLFESPKSSDLTPLFRQLIVVLGGDAAKAFSLPAEAVPLYLIVLLAREISRVDARIHLTKGE